MAAFHYEYKVNGLMKVSADVAGAVCNSLQNSAGGLTPKTLLDASRDESAPLHGEFEWDDTVAAERYREEQASCIIRNIVIVQDTVEESHRDRAFVNIPGGKSEYVTLHSALTNEDWKEHLLEDAKRDMRAFLGKYRRLEELAGINTAILQFLDEQDGLTA